MKKIENYYKNKLGFTDFYNIVMGYSYSCKNEFIQSENLLKGLSYTPISISSTFISSELGDIRIDVPIWFGDLQSASKRIIVFGLEPRDTNAAFNIEKIGNKIFARPFGIDRWNNSTSVKGKPQNKYFRVFEDLIADSESFVLFSDIVKDYEIVSENNKNKENDKKARGSFSDKAKKGLANLKEEIDNIEPTHIIALGNASFNFLSKYYPQTIKLTHPAQGGEKQAKTELENILK